MGSPISFHFGRLLSYLFEIIVNLFVRLDTKNVLQSNWSSFCSLSCPVLACLPVASSQFRWRLCELSNTPWCYLEWFRWMILKNSSTCSSLISTGCSTAEDTQRHQNVWAKHYSCRAILIYVLRCAVGKDHSTAPLKFAIESGGGVVRDFCSTITVLRFPIPMVSMIGYVWNRKGYLTDVPHNENASSKIIYCINSTTNSEYIKWEYSRCFNHNTHSISCFLLAFKGEGRK